MVQAVFGSIRDISADWSFLVVMSDWACTIVGPGMVRSPSLFRRAGGLAAVQQFQLVPPLVRCLPFAC